VTVHEVWDIVSFNFFIQYWNCHWGYSNRTLCYCNGLCVQLSLNRALEHPCSTQSLDSNFIENSCIRLNYPCRSVPKNVHAYNTICVQTNHNLLIGPFLAWAFLFTQCTHTCYLQMQFTIWSPSFVKLPKDTFKDYQTDQLSF